MNGRPSLSRLRSEASLGTELLTQTPPVPHTQTPIPGITNSTPCVLLPVYHGSSKKPGTHWGCKDGCRVVLPACGELTSKGTIIGYGDEGQHGGGG